MKKAFALHWKTGVGTIACALALSTAAIADHHEQTASLQTEQQKIGYSFGQMFGRRLSSTMADIDLDAFVQGIRDVYNKQPSRLSDEEISQAIKTYQQEQVQALATNNLEKGKKFLAENAGKDGVMATTSGLQYKINTAGEGSSPKLNDSVEVHYTGSLINGEVFDSSVQRGKSVSFPVSGVIPGWTEALQLMKPGDKWQLFIPAELAYGTNGNGRIGPNETLIFDVELIAVN